MGVRLIVGEVDGTRHGAAMYDSVSGWMIGPIFEADDAVEQIDAFQEWLRTESRWRTAAARGLVDLRTAPVLDADDVRQWGDGPLGRLIAYWRKTYTDDGGLLDVRACRCGHSHDDRGCLVGDCGCAGWSPGNTAAAAHADGV